MIFDFLQAGNYHRTYGPVPCNPGGGIGKCRRGYSHRLSFAQFLMPMTDAQSALAGIYENGLKADLLAWLRNGDFGGARLAYPRVSASFVVLCN
jgi:hypothetical protein